MKYLSILILALFSISADQKMNFRPDLLSESHWVVNVFDGNIHDFEDYDMIIYDSPETDDLPLSIKYRGITFNKDGTFIEHTWNKCGTGNSPNHFKGEFTIIEIGNDQIIKISNSRNWNGEYIVVNLTENNLRLKRKK